MTNTASKTQKLTDKQFHALKAILAMGGVGENDGTLHQGRLTPGTLNKGLCHRMVEAGLLVREWGRLYVSVKGCEAVRAVEEAAAYEALCAEGLDYTFRMPAAKAA